MGTGVSQWEAPTESQIPPAGHSMMQDVEPEISLNTGLDGSMGEEAFSSSNPMISFHHTATRPSTVSSIDDIVAPDTLTDPSEAPRHRDLKSQAGRISQV